MGFFDKFISQPGLGIPREKQQSLQAELLQKELSDIYDQQKLPLEQRLPVMQVPRGGEEVIYKNSTHDPGDILLPHFGIVKKDIQWPEGHKRKLLQDGGFIEADLNQKEIDNLVKQGYVIEDM